MLVVLNKLLFYLLLRLNQEFFWLPLLSSDKGVLLISGRVRMFLFLRLHVEVAASEEYLPVARRLMWLHWYGHVPSDLRRFKSNLVGFIWRQFWILWNRGFSYCLMSRPVSFAHCSHQICTPLSIWNVAWLVSVSPKFRLGHRVCDPLLSLSVWTHRCVSGLGVDVFWWQTSPHHLELINLLLLLSPLKVV